MKIFLDADGSPVLKEVETLARKYDLSLVIVSDYNHRLKSKYGDIITVDSSKDSADFYIFNQISSGDILITQDLGLGAMVLAKKAFCLNENGDRITEDNVDFLLNNRHISSKLRREEAIYSKIPKRQPGQDIIFSRALEELILRVKS